AVWLAKATGNPVVPFHIEADRSWSMNSWDRTQIPKPFATIAIAIGEPFDVPRDADAAAIDRARRSLEERLQALETRATAVLEQDPYPNNGLVKRVEIRPWTVVVPSEEPPR